ncbi:hypothetical protein SAMN05216318_10184 [Nitrosomonas eutropha]|nr:hypothetical protein SAMN05216318_10184 [Nitrosomonas eutropha]
MRRPSCSLLEARTEVLQDESDANVDEPSYEVSGMRKAAAACALRTGNCCKGECARRRDGDEFKQTKKAPPWVGPVCGRSLGIPGVAPLCPASACRNLRCWGCRCTKPIGLGNCPVSLGRPSSCRPHAIGTGFCPHCWWCGAGRHCGVQ